MRPYRKDFEAWNLVKKKLQLRQEPATFHEREIWWTAIGHNVGAEEDGKGVDYTRPVLILRKFNHDLFWGIPLTTNARDSKYYVRFRYQDRRTSAAILSQLRVFDVKRLLFQDGAISQLDYARVQLGLVEILRGEPWK